MHLHESIKETVIRVYDEPDGYAERKPYIASATIDYLTHDTAYLSNLMGSINRSVMRSVKQHLKKQGVKTLMYERRGEMKTERL